MDPILLCFVYPGCMGLLADAIQNCICRWKVSLLLRLLPGLALLAGVAGCAAPFILEPYSDDMLTAVGAFILGWGLTGMLLGCVAAWVHYSIVRNKQNPGK